MRLTYRRIIELELEPVAGQFYAPHLKEVNRPIFQDLPAAGINYVFPGEYRPAVPAGTGWLKHHVLSTNGVAYFVAYSPMDASAQRQIDMVLAHVKPDMLAKLPTDDLTKQLAELYVKLDFFHPFSDGNSRTLRTFTTTRARYRASASREPLEGRYKEYPNERYCLPLLQACIHALSVERQ
jgi:cell filamentation protein